MQVTGDPEPWEQAQMGRAQPQHHTERPDVPEWMSHVLTCSSWMCCRGEGDLVFHPEDLVVICLILVLLAKYPIACGWPPLEVLIIVLCRPHQPLQDATTHVMHVLLTPATAVLRWSSAAACCSTQTPSNSQLKGLFLSVKGASSLPLYMRMQCTSQHCMGQYARHQWAHVSMLQLPHAAWQRQDITTLFFSDCTSLCCRPTQKPSLQSLALECPLQKLMSQDAGEASL